MRKATRLLLVLVALAAIAALVRTRLVRRQEPHDVHDPGWLAPEHEPADDTATSGEAGGREAGDAATDRSTDAPLAEATVAVAAVWVPPVAGAAPEGYPVKVKVSSGLYHLPGMANYTRTVPDRCYASAENAQADGFRPAKR
jgi:hypothetical protein